MKRVIDIVPICIGLWRVTVEHCGELMVDVIPAGTRREAWDKALA